MVRTLVVVLFLLPLLGAKAYADRPAKAGIREHTSPSGEYRARAVPEVGVEIYRRNSSSASRYVLQGTAETGYGGFSSARYLISDHGHLIEVIGWPGWGSGARVLRVFKARAYQVSASYTLGNLFTLEEIRSMPHTVSHMFWSGKTAIVTGLGTEVLVVGIPTRMRGLRPTDQPPAYSGGMLYVDLNSGMAVYCDAPDGTERCRSGPDKRWQEPRAFAPVRAAKASQPQQ